MPNAMGSRSRGSNLCFIARYMKTKEIRIITTFCHVIAASPDWAIRS